VPALCRALTYGPQRRVDPEAGSGPAAAACGTGECRTGRAQSCTTKTSEERTTTKQRRKNHADRTDNGETEKLCGSMSSPPRGPNSRRIPNTSASQFDERLGLLVDVECLQREKSTTGPAAQGSQAQARPGLHRGHRLRPQTRTRKSVVRQLATCPLGPGASRCRDLGRDGNRQDLLWLVRLPSRRAGAVTPLSTTAPRASSTNWPWPAPMAPMRDCWPGSRALTSWSSTTGASPSRARLKSTCAPQKFGGKSTSRKFPRDSSGDPWLIGFEPQ